MVLKCAFSPTLEKSFPKLTPIQARSPTAGSARGMLKKINVMLTKMEARGALDTAMAGSHTAPCLHIVHIDIVAA